MAPGPIVVFSHLRWSSVHQRPHHLLSRFAREAPVLFVEEPVLDEASVVPSWELTWPQPGVTVATPRTTVAAPGYHPDQIPTLTSLARHLLRALHVERPVAWLYTPLALPLATAIAPTLLVYDCMDELSAFLGAPPEMEAREAALLARADVVFTGGPSLYRAKQHRARVVRCFPSSVDAAHFRRAGAEPADQRALPAGPKLGFYGVLDERLDRALLDAVARAHPDWQLVMVGPVVKIDPASLPRRPNVHYLGQRSYEELPGYLHGWDVCLLPFARNEATRFISPTKTLEYMAAGKPIVSTPIRDVVDLYGDLVHCADGPEAFVAACRAALASPPAVRAERAARMHERLARTSWDATAAAMQREIREAHRRARRLRVAPAPAAASLAFERSAVELEEYS